MDTTVVWHCLKRFANIGFGIACLLFLYSCPGEDMDCHDLGSIAEVPDLVILTPEQAVYNSGDELTLKLEIPAINSYYGSEIDLFGITGDDNAKLVLGFDQLFLGNTLIFIEGNQSEFPNWFDMPFNSETGLYELEIKIILDRTGFYSFYTGDSVYIQGSDYCNRFRIDTNVPWNITNGRIEFTVTE